jgi:glycosyltransferase involved in cell wall biosynthesis
MPYLVNYHNDLIGIGLRGKIFSVYNRAFGGLVLGQAALILAVTLDHAQNCRAASIFRKYNRQVVELNNGVDVEHFSLLWDGQPIRDRLGIPFGAKVVLFVGALDLAHHFKGLSVLLDAFKVSARDDTHLIVVGDGEMLESYRSRSVALGLGGATSFVGRIPHSDLPAYYAASDVVVLPSSPPESFGMVIVEGMACGKPVIGSRIPGVRSLIDEGRDGFLIHPGDAEDLAARLTMLLELSPEERSLMGAAGRRKVVERFSWQSIGYCLERYYYQVLGT